MLLAIDQGTTSTRAIVFSAALDVKVVAQCEYKQHYPHPGWVEHDPEDLWSTTLAMAREALQRAGIEARQVTALGITNQRETALLWDRSTGKPIHNAIVWQDRRTAGACAALRAEGQEKVLTERSGLLADSYFSGTKIAWMLDTVEGARTAAERGQLAFGTVDTFLLWRLTGGRVHVTDATNASRTMLYNIHDGVWDDELLRLLRVPASVLPEVRDSAGLFGTTDRTLFGAPIPIRGIAGDQQAAMVGQACFEPGMMKVTYGTGAFALLNTGTVPVPSAHRLLTTVAYQLHGRRHYALEGSIFVAGAGVQWLRDALGIIAAAADTQALADAADPEQPVYFVPAFVGLGAPYWDAEARGALLGLTRGAGRPEIARATLEAVGYQTHDLYSAMCADWPGGGGGVLRVDGGMAASDWTMQFVADMLDAPVDRPVVRETTALGAAYLAGYDAGVCDAPAASCRSWKLERRFRPGADVALRERKLAGWADAVRRVRSRE